MIKNTSKLLVLAIITVIMCLGCLFVSAAETDGAAFTKDDMYGTKKPLSSLPSTYEATVYFPAGTANATRGGVIVGDFVNMSTSCFSFEIHKSGNPRLYFIDSNKTAYSYIFNEINVYTGEWVHIAIVKDSSNESITCYIDGVPKQTITQASPETFTLKSNAYIGGDMRPNNEQFFKGRIKNVALYSDIRTAAEITSDASGTYGTDNLLGFYEVTQDAKKLTDKNGSGPEFVSNNPWIDKEPVKDYAYSIAVVGDTQTLALYYQAQFTQVYNWIIENAEEKNMQFVIGLGDITDKDSRDEWTLAKSTIKKLNGVVPYSLVRGNHDSVAMFNKFFPYSEFGSTVSGSFDQTLLNTYHEFSVGDIKYLLVNLDMGPSDEVLEWANKVVSEHPNHNVIVSTHVYLYHDGTTLDVNDNAAASKIGGHNDGDDIWTKFVKKHKNIVLVLSGHDPSDKIITTKVRGENGNVVTQMLIDPQTTDKTYGGVGLVAMLYFSEDGSHIDVEYISTAKNKYFLDENQFSLDISVVKPAVEADPTPDETTANTNDTVSSPEENNDQPTETTPSTTNAANNEPKSTGMDTLTIIAIIAAAIAVIAVIACFFVLKKPNEKNK